MGILLAPVKSNWGMFYNVTSHSVTAICCTRIRWHTYGKVYLFAIFFQLSKHIIWHDFPPPPVFHFWIACYVLLLAWYFLPFWQASFFCKGLLYQAGQMGNLFLLLLSYQLLFPKACELSVAFLKGSCWATHRNIFSIWWCRIRLPSTPDKSLFGQASWSCL